jgi:uncharacterized membrane protein YhfC
MNTLSEFADMLAYIQDHGGIMAMFIVAVVMRSIDMYRVDQKIEAVERRAVDRTAVHELYWHNPDARDRRKDDHKGVD